MSVQTLTTWTGLAMCAVIISVWTWKWLGRMQRRDSLELVDRFRRKHTTNMGPAGNLTLLWDEDFILLARKPDGQSLEDFLKRNIPGGTGEEFYLTIDGWKGQRLGLTLQNQSTGTKVWK